MDPPHDDCFASLAKLRGDLVGARGIGGHDGKADHVTGKVEVDILNRFIHQTDFPILRRVGGNHRQAQLGEPYRTPLRSSQPIGVIARVGIDQ